MSISIIHFPKFICNAQAPKECIIVWCIIVWSQTKMMWIIFNFYSQPITIWNLNIYFSYFTSRIQSTINLFLRINTTFVLNHYITYNVLHRKYESLEKYLQINFQKTGKRVKLNVLQSPLNKCNYRSKSLHKIQCTLYDVQNSREISTINFPWNVLN